MGIRNRLRRAAVLLWGGGLFFFAGLLTLGAQSYAPTLAALEAADNYSETKFQEMRQKSQQLMRDWAVSAEERAAFRYDLAKAYLQRDDRAEAFIQLHMAVRVQFDAWEAQLLLAEIEEATGRFLEARDRLIFIDREAPAGALKTYTRQLLGKDTLSSLNEYPQPPYLERGVIYLATYGEVPPLMTQSLASRIRQEYGLNVKIASQPINLDPGRIRNNLEPYFDSVLENLKKELGEERMKEKYEEYGLSAKGPQTLDQKGTMVRDAMLSQENGAALWQQALWENQNQMEVMDLFEQLKGKTAALNREPNVLGVLAITNYDLYGGDEPFVFGYGEKGLHLMSIFRFTMPGVPVRNSLKMNSLQAMTAVIQMLGLPRSADMSCATAPIMDVRHLMLRRDALAPDTRLRLQAHYNELMR